MNKIKNVIFDIGNVLVDFHPIPYFSSLMPEGQMEMVCPLIFDDVWEAIDRGDYLCEHAKNIQLAKFPQYKEQIVCIYDHWMEMMSLYEDTLSFYQACQSHGYRVFLLSNIGLESHAYLRQKFPFFDLADGMVLSYQERCIKPDPKIFQILLDRYQLEPEECLFLDDKQNNVDTAKSCGMQAIVFTSAAQAQKEAALW